MTKHLCAAALVALVAPAFAAEWMTDLDAARARAAAENKAVLVDFTGSDWCTWCIYLKKNVFDKPAFNSYAKDKFVLVEVDVPNNPSFDRELLQRNQQLCEQYRVSSFPTVMVMTPGGDVVGGFQGGMASVADARVPLNAALANAAALKAADALKGEARVNALYKVYQNVPGEFRASSALGRRIAELDRGRLTGIHDEMEAQEQMDKVEAELKAAGQDGRAMLAVVERALKKAHARNRRALLEMKADLQLMEARSEADILAAKKTLLELADTDDRNAAALRARIEQRFANPAQLLRRILQIRGEQ